MFGLSFEKILLIGIVAAFLIGPQKLPHYAAILARMVRQVRDFANGAKDRIKEEMGPEYDDIEWKSLDPRQYDPRRIIREALLEPSVDQAKTELLPNHDDYPMARMDPIDPSDPSELGERSERSERSELGERSEPKGSPGFRAQGIPHT